MLILPTPTKQKFMPKPFAKPYNPQKVERKIYQLWEKSGYFNPDKLPNGKTQNSKPKTSVL
jgi:valyl-tRNA synthetase